MNSNIKPRKRLLRLAVLVALAGGALMPSAASAADRFWVCGSRWWDSYGVSAGCWAATAGGAGAYSQPQNGDTVYLTQSDATNRTVSYWNTDYPSAVLDSLTLDATGAGTMTLSQSQDPLAAYWEYIGYNGTGAYTQDGGTNTVNSYLELGFNSGSNGTYTLSGTGSLTAGSETIGYFGTGVFTQSGGTHTVSGSSLEDLILGDASGSSGTYNLSAGNLSVGGPETIGNSGTGVFTQSGGTHTVGSYLALGGGGGSGTYDLSGTGSLSAVREYIGYFGTGVFTQSGGTHTVSSDLILGAASGSSGTYTLSGGTLDVGGNIVDGAGSSTFNLDGGTLTVGSSGSGSIDVDNLVLGKASGADVSYILSAAGLYEGTRKAASALTVSNLTLGGSGTGAFTQSGGTHTVTNTLTIAANAGSSGSYDLQGGSLSADTVQLNSGGTFTQTGGNLLFTSFNQDGGTVAGTLQNPGTFNYNSGTFSGRLVNNGTANFNTDFTAGNGMEHNTTLTIGAGRTITLDGSGLDNNGTITLAGGVLAGGGVLTNNGELSGYGTIGGSGGFVNNALFTQSGGHITLTNTGANANYGNMDLASGYQLRLNGATLSNGGTLNLNSAVVNGTGTLNNSYGGTISGRGTISSNFNNNGGVVAVGSGTTNITKNFANSSLIQLGSATANLVGGTIANSGTVEGYGHVGNNIGNTGIIEAIGGTLSLSGTVNNNAGGLMAASTGNKLMVNNGLAGNAGTISLTGGTFDNNNNALSNTGQISGYGTLRTGGLTNSGSMTLTGGTTTVNGNVTNGAGGNLEVAHNPAIFTGDVVNNGTIKTTNTTATFAGAYTENGVFISDPSNNYFTDVAIGANGYWVGGVGDNFFISGNFVNNSLQNMLWNTNAASLFLNGTGLQNLYLAGSDMGALMSGYGNNFAWGEFSLGSGVSTKIWDGNGDPGAALYVGLFELGGGLSQLGGIYSDFNIYYDPALAGNAYLGGQTYALNGAGFLAPAAVPLPAAAWLFGSGLLGLIGVARRKAGRDA